jgi:uncharacterized protein YkwD
VRNTSSALLLLALGGAAGCIVPVLPSSTVPPPPVPVAADLAGVEHRVHDLVNAHRGRHGLPPLERDETLSGIARRHSEDMARGRVAFGHAGFDGRSAEIRRHTSYRAIAENVAWNTQPLERTAEVAVSGWLGSEGHRRNIEGRFLRTGIGAIRAAGGGYYYTQIFLDGR